MRYSKLLLKTNKEARKFDSVNATLLQKAGFVDQTMAGVYTFLPLGWRVLTKIEDIIREEMNKVGTEMLMPALAPTELWQKTGRAESVDVLMQAGPANEASQRKNDGRYIMNSTHEEVITPIVQRIKPSYKDLPLAVYQIQTKFRNEERPKSGLLRGREFRMKDLYSFHANDEDRRVYYEQVMGVYQIIFDRLGIGAETVLARASGGDFSSGYSHEFNTKCEAGEDVVYFDLKQNVYVNAEIASPELKKKAEPVPVAEVGNIFPLGTKFSEAFGYYYTDESGLKQPVYMASYGIGSSRVMGVLVELWHDDKGIVWPEVAPFMIHLIVLANKDQAIKKRADDLYVKLKDEGIEVLLDDRDDVSAGEKMADADLVGVPWRVVISSRTGEQVEIKRRGENQEKLISVDELLKLGRRS